MFQNVPEYTKDKATLTGRHHPATIQRYWKGFLKTQNLSPPLPVSVTSRYVPVPPSSWNSAALAGPSPHSIPCKVSSHLSCNVLL